ncbi:MAG: histidine phosphatase family protein [Rhodospirillales bacterium]|nr:histidine phosphatase family protein [Rhodospirillales bacterium]
MTTPPPDSLPLRPFWYLRHGETDWNAQGLSQGNVDIPLNATGLAQARAAAASLRGRNIATIVASPLSRARVTAEIVSEAIGVPILFDDDLREVAFGEQEGLPMGTWYDSWIAGDYTPEGAETFAALRHRAVASVTRALDRPAPLLVVAHGALFRALRAAMGVPPNERTRNAVPMWCEPPPAGETAWRMEYVV